MDELSRRTEPRPRNGHSKPRQRTADADSLDRLRTKASAANAQVDQWKSAYRRNVLVVDALIIVAVVTLAEIGSPLVAADGPTGRVGWQQETVISVILVISWLVALGLQQSRDFSLVGMGSEEYPRVVTATAWVFSLIAVLGVLFSAPMSRAHFIALVLGLIGLVVGRHHMRRVVARRRTRGEFITRVVVLGNLESVRVLCQSLARAPAAGYRVVGVCIPDFVGEVGQELVMPTGVVPILGADTAVENALRFVSADALAVAAAEHLGYENMKKLAWRMQSLDIELIVVSGMTDVARHRLRMRLIDNLPLFHIAPPRQDRASALAKRLFDLALGTALLLTAFPIMALAAVAIKIEDGGPMIFRQERVGYRGKRFRIVKLRTMMVDADARKEAEEAGEASVFYKSACDSRITRVGRYLRATSIDELPQLFNVLGGSMTIVGPRPLVPGEGASVEHFVERRELVKPGMTGLWQVSGRSGLSDNERIRLDYSYVDNSSGVQDLMIVWRTVRAVLKRDGAY